MSNGEKTAKSACPCGSGKRYKECCGHPARERARRNRKRWLAPMAVAVGLGVLLALTASDRNPPPTRQTPVAEPVQAPVSAPGTAVGQPRPNTGTPPAFYYDESTNKHWDPTHNHWHDGPPPAGAAVPPATGETPPPYHYDASTNKHWDPAHNHWHDGPPPAGATGSNGGADVSSEPEAVPGPESEESR